MLPSFLRTTMKLMRVVVAVTMLVLGVASARSGIFSTKPEKRTIPVTADGKPIPQCLPGDPRCIPGMLP